MLSSWNLFHRLKFGSWNLARRNPAIAAPIKLAKVATRSVAAEYQKILEAGKERLLPANRYIRPARTPTQVVVITPIDGGGSDEFLGLGLLLSHLRIPYRRLTSTQAESVKADLLLLCGATPKELPPSLRDIALVVEQAARFLPYRDGLRSKHAIDLISRLLIHVQKKPLVTGMLPARVALRLDDVAGVGIEHYLMPAVARGWKANLGIFISDFQGTDARKMGWLRELGAEGKVDFSPHAFTPSQFIFFDYPRGRAFTDDEFRARWEIVKTQFRGWRFPISPVLNTHFHSLSLTAVRALKATGRQYFFSELALDSVGRIPSPNYLPSGDPTLTTGSTETGSLLQIYSGDSTLDSNQPRSLYDFMMHLKGESPENEAAERVLSRLELTLNTGFASFVTTHEYQLTPFSHVTHDLLWDRIEQGLSSLAPAPPRKVSMKDLGELCWDHTHTCVESVREGTDGRWTVTLSGEGKGVCPLILFNKGCFIEFPVPAFNGEIEIEINNHEPKNRIQV
jgi:hypothetical protein